MKQKELSNGKLLNSYGNLHESGYAKSLVKEYNRKDITASKLRIKEWDYYYIGNDQFGIALTIADNAYIGLGSISLLDFASKTYITKSAMTFFPMGKTNMPSSSRSGNVLFKTKKCKISFTNDGKKRVLAAHYNNFDKKLDFDCVLELYDEPSESMVIATPFEKKHHFYYNQKINCIKAKGKATIGGKVYTFNPYESYATLDWGRGVWTYANTWFWASMSGVSGGKKLGFNLGYGFGDNKDATENMLFYDGKAHKIEQVTFHIQKKANGKEDYLKPWKFTSNDKAIELEFTPILNRRDNTNIVFLKSLQNQVFGVYNGAMKINDEIVIIKDMIGFAEKVKNWW